MLDDVELVLHRGLECLVDLLQAKYVAHHELKDVLCSGVVLQLLEVVLGYLDLSKKVARRHFLHEEGFDLAQS